MQEQSSIQVVNQQVTESELGWLAGIIDGEGSIGISSRFKNGQKTSNFLACFQITTTSPKMIMKVGDILKKLGVDFYQSNQTLSYVNPNHQDTYRIAIGRLSQMKTFLESVIKYLVVKDGQAEIALRFVNSRIEKGAKRGNPNVQRYTNEEIALKDEIFAMNLRGNNRLRKQESSTTTREAVL